MVKNIKEANQWFINKHRHEASCIYLIDTGITIGPNKIYKYGRTTDLVKRMAKHITTWHYMEILHIEPVVDSINCEKRVKELLGSHLYKGTIFKQCELLVGKNPHHFIETFIKISTEETAALLAKHTMSPPASPPTKVLKVHVPQSYYDNINKLMDNPIMDGDYTMMRSSYFSAP